VDELVEADTLGLQDADAIVMTGRVLVWERDTTVDDGVGEAETGGFLDDSFMPPWDTWVASVEEASRAGCLLSCIPGVFVERVQRVIDVNAYGALYWLVGSSISVTNLLESWQLSI
jgi:hypothetical protein